MSGNTEHIPSGFHTVTPYLTVGNAGDLLDFVKRVFDAEEASCYRDSEGRIMHAAVSIGDSMIELSDSTEQWKPTPCSLHIYVPDCDAVYRRAVDAGATSLYEPTDHFYGERSGGVRDTAGNNWYIATVIEEVSDEELHRRMAEMKQQ